MLKSAIEGIVIALSHHRRVNGLWIGVSGAKQDFHLLDRVEEAIALVCERDRIAYRRIYKNLDRIWVLPLAGARGSFSASAGACKLDSQYVGTNPPELIASTIIHEATHAHPCLRKFGNSDAIRRRVEGVCIRRQLAFAQRLSDGTRVREQAERLLQLPSAFWSEESRHKAQVEAARSYLTAENVPQRMVTSIFFITRVIRRFRS